MSRELPRRVYRLATAANFFMAGICFASWASRIPHIQQKLHLSDGTLGFVLLSLPIGLIASLPIAGWLVAKFGSRNIALAASLSYSAVLCLLGLSDATWQLAGALFLFGFSGSIINIAVNTQALAVQSKYEQSIMATFHGVWSLAGFSGAAVGTLMVNLHIIPTYHFIIIALLIWITAWYVSGKSIPEKSSATKTPLFVMPSGELLLLGFMAMACMMCEGTMFDWSGVYFSKIVHAKASLVTIGYVAFMSCMAAGRFISDRLVTKMGVVKMLQISGVLIASGLILSIILPTVITAALGFMLVGFGVSSVVPLAYGLAGRNKKMSTSMALAAVSTIGYFGFLFGPPLIGFIAAASDLRWSFALIACMGLGISLLARRFAHT